MDLGKDEFKIRFTRTAISRGIRKIPCSPHAPTCSERLIMEVSKAWNTS